MSNLIFVTHANQDQDFARRVQKQLVSMGCAIWHDGLIGPGSNWAEEIRKGLDQSSTLLFLVSPHSIMSVPALAELQYGIEQGKTVIPFLISNVNLESGPAELADYELIDVRNVDQSRLADRLAERLGGSFDAKSSELSYQSKGYVFLSYAHEDSEFVAKLKQFLEEQGYGYWDYEESDRDYHSQLFLELEEAILGSAALFAVLSEDWKRSRWTVREYFFAEDAGTPVFLLRSKALRPTLAVAGMPYIDFEDDESDGFTKLNRELERKGL